MSKVVGQRRLAPDFAKKSESFCLSVNPLGKAEATPIGSEAMIGVAKIAGADKKRPDFL